MLLLEHSRYRPFEETFFETPAIELFPVSIFLSYLSCGDFFYLFFYDVQISALYIVKVCFSSLAAILFIEREDLQM